MVSANSANSQLWNFGLNSPKLNRAVCLYVFPMILTVISSCACRVILERQISHATSSSSTHSRTSSERMGVVLTGTFNRRQNCLCTLLKWDNFEEQINPVHTRPSPLLSNLEYLLFLTCCSNSGTRLYGRGKGEWRLYFPFFFKLAKRQRGPFGQSVSNKFVADCSSDSDPAGFGENALISNLNCALC